MSREFKLEGAKKDGACTDEMLVAAPLQCQGGHCCRLQSLKTEAFISMSPGTQWSIISNLLTLTLKVSFIHLTEGRKHQSIAEIGPWGQFT